MPCLLYRWAVLLEISGWTRSQAIRNMHFELVFLTLQTAIQPGIAMSVYHVDCGNIAHWSCCDWNDTPSGLLLSGCLPHRASFQLSSPGRFWVIMSTLEQYNSVHSRWPAYIHFVYVYEGTNGPTHWCHVIGMTIKCYVGGVWSFQFHGIIKGIHWQMYV